MSLSLYACKVEYEYSDNSDNIIVIISQAIKPPFMVEHLQTITEHLPIQQHQKID